MDKKDIKRSKFLSMVLRHLPESVGLTLDQNGWIDVRKLLSACAKKGVIISPECLERIVETNDKKRFAFNEDRTKIRASQGHSVSVDLLLKPTAPPEYLYHGTAMHFLSSIQNRGLVKGRRQHVHLSHDVVTAIQVGRRHGDPVVLKVLAKDMMDNGYLFYVSDNGVWLTDHVPSVYLVQEDRKGTHSDR
ncbi:RNA 2'-phosphotransferase [Risungbinella massiliensis]|uniref:RNA 2'-phosphotransferase n=1 Tax=Risungbinella massiliensis TaxID=1329796 RepID=UPI0005CBAF1E|nr:RNA 2'-phosphotransferase [Risungbinella massiliensis]